VWLTIKKIKKMKNLKLLIYSLFATLVVLSACKKKDEKSDLDKRKEAVSASWEVDTISAGTEDVSFEQTVVITFSTNGTYSIQNIESLNAANVNHSGILSASGNWEISESNLNVVSIGGGNSITITQLNEANFNFTYSGPFPKESDDERNISFSTVIAE